MKIRELFETYICEYLQLFFDVQKKCSSFIRKPRVSNKIVSFAMEADKKGTIFFTFCKNQHPKKRPK
jgi:hypothetical protein